MGKFVPPAGKPVRTGVQRCRPNEILTIADELTARRKYGEAIARCRTYLHDCGFDWQVQNRLGDLYVNAGDKTNAVNAYHELVEHWLRSLEPDRSDPSYDNHFSASATAVLRKIVRVDPSNIEALRHLAQLRERQGLVADAIHWWKILADALESRSEIVAAASCRQRAANLKGVETPEQPPHTPTDHDGQSPDTEREYAIAASLIAKAMQAEADGLKSDAAAYWSAVGDHYELVGNAYYAAEYRLRARLAQQHSESSSAKSVEPQVPVIDLSWSVQERAGDLTDSFTATSATDWLSATNATEPLTTRHIDSDVAVRPRAVVHPSTPQKTSLIAFLCHASEDRILVRDLHRKLRSDAFVPWLDGVDLLPGQQWATEIAAAIRRSHVVLICVSNTSLRKVSYLQKEIKLALDVLDEQPNEAIYAIPVKLEPCDLPESLSKLQAVDLYLEDGYERLRRALIARVAQIESR